MVKYNLFLHQLEIPLKPKYLVLYTAITVTCIFCLMYMTWVAMSEISHCYCRAKCTDHYFKMCYNTEDFTEFSVIDPDVPIEPLDLDELPGLDLKTGKDVGKPSYTGITGNGTDRLDLYMR